MHSNHYVTPEIEVIEAEIAELICSSIGDYPSFNPEERW